MEKIYQSINPIAVRIALGTEMEYLKFMEKESVKDLSNEVKESILAASTDLFESMSKDITQNKYEAMIRSVFKYEIRRATRCTPYGFFAGVGVGKYLEKTNLKFDNSCVIKRARVDMNWLFNYINQIIKKESLILGMKVRINKSCYRKGDRFYNPVYSEGGNSEDNKSRIFSIRFTKSVEFVINLTQNYILCKDLLEEIVKKFDIAELKAKNFLLDLIKHEFLILQIFPPLINTNPLTYVIDILNKCGEENDEIEFLSKINQKLNIYNKMRLGDGIENYKEIINYMKSKVEARNYIQVDAKIILYENGISFKIKEEIEKTVNMLTMLSSGYSEPDFLIKYKEEFIDKYGYWTEVPILELLDESIGLGIPANYKGSQKKHVECISPNKAIDEMNNLLLNRAIKAIKDGVNKIYINDTDLKEVCKNFTMNTDILLDTQEIFAQILADKSELIDNGEFELLLSGCISSSGALNSLGRFSDMFWNEQEVNKELKEIEENLLGNEYIIAELTEQFTTGRIANVDMNYNSWDYQLCTNSNFCSGKEHIELDDIYIGIDKKTQRFYAKSHKFNKKIYARTTHMLNPSLGSAPYRFLRDISSMCSKFQTGEEVAMLGSNKFIYFPRIMYGKTILKPARWRVDCKKTKHKEFNAWDKEFLDYVLQYNIPEYVNYIVGDNFLKIDLKEKKCRELLYYSISISKEFILTEDLTKDSYLWIKDNAGYKHCGEMVFTCVKKQKINKSVTKEEIQLEKPYYSNDKGRILFPGEDGWFYYRLYGMIGREDEFIGSELKRLSESLYEREIIDHHYFIRYFDQKMHVRVRFQVKKGMSEEFMSTFHSWLIEERSKGMVTDLSLSVYEREIERYGGYGVYSLAENIFEADSLFVESLKEAEYFKIRIPDRECLAIWSIQAMLSSFGMDSFEAESWLSLDIKNNDYREIYKESEKKYIDSLEMDKNKVPENIFKNYLKRNKLLRIYWDEMRGGETKFSNTKDDILSSFIHMFCNRFMADTEWETKVRALTRHSLHSINSYNKYKIKRNISEILEK